MTKKKIGAVQYLHRRLPADGVWRQVGSGCLLIGNLSMPYDAEYQRRFKAGRTESVTMFATVSAGRRLPLRAKTLAELTRRSGVMVGGKAWWIERDVKKA